MVSVCATCNGLQKHLGVLDGAGQETGLESFQWVNTTLPSLRRSSNGGCRACAVLLQGILLHHDRFAGVGQETVRVKAESFHPASNSNAQDHLSVEVRWKEPGDGCCPQDRHQHEDGYPDLKLEFFTDQDGQSPFSAIGQGRRISVNPVQDSGLDLSASRSMVNECLQSHSRCRHARPTTLPRRILDVLTDDISKGISLHESAFSHEEQRYEFGEYLALSHCHGTGSGVPKTTTETLQAHKKNIPWSSLPKTFQEAVIVARSVGFRWLWIDSLCIVQDDPAEKQEESLRTDEIFGNAFLTLAATSATHSNQGLFPPKTQPFKIQATDSKGSLFKTYVREQPSHYSFKAPFDEGSHMNDWELPFNTSEDANLHTPLLKRAWAYTERLLSPRVLHFTKSEMILECKEGYQCECGRIDNSTFDSRTTDSVKQEFARVVAEGSARGEIVNGAVHGNDRRIDSVVSQLAASSLTDVARDLTQKRQDALQLWTYIVTEYTARNLTYDADRLVAIAGVAKSLFDSLNSGYIAGQWTFSTMSLLWHPNDGSRSRRTTANNVPSWSWASVEGSPIFFDNSSAMDLACTASFPAERGRETLWSPTTGDILELTASMATEVTLRVDGYNEYSLVRNGVSADFRPDVIPPQGEEVAIESGEELICVLVSMTFRSSVIGLVLQKSKSNAQHYRRVGRFECYECQRDGSNAEPDDAESLFEHWFPEIEDMTQLDDGPQRTFIVV